MHPGHRGLGPRAFISVRPLVGACRDRQCLSDEVEALRQLGRLLGQQESDVVPLKK